MKHFVILVLLLIPFHLTIFSQKPKKVSAELTFYAPETMSVVEAQRIALEKAKLKAIAEEFGTYISQSNSAIYSESNGVSSDYFSSISGTDVKGDWR